MKSGEAGLGWRYRQPEFVREQGKARFDAEHVGGDKARRPQVARQGPPEIARLPVGHEDLEAELAGVAEPPDRAGNARQIRMTEREIWQPPDHVGIAEIAQCVERAR